jgi:hypothetical protein
MFGLWKKCRRVTKNIKRSLRVESLEPRRMLAGPNAARAFGGGYSLSILGFTTIGAEGVALAGNVGAPAGASIGMITEVSPVGAALLAPAKTISGEPPGTSLMLGAGAIGPANLEVWFLVLQGTPTASGTFFMTLGASIVIPGPITLSVSKGAIADIAGLDGTSWTLDTDQTAYFGPGTDVPSGDTLTLDSPAVVTHGSDLSVEGTLVNNSTLTTYGATVNVDGGTLDNQSGGEIIANYTTAVYVSGTLENESGAAINLNESSTVEVQSGGELLVDSGSTLTEDSTSQITNDSGGETTISSGSTLDLSGTISNSGTLTLSSDGESIGSLVSNAGTTDLNGGNLAVSALSGSGGTITNNGSSAATLTVNQAVDTVFAGTMEDGTANLGLAMTGSGALQLTGSLSLSGEIDNYGTLELSGSSITTYGTLNNYGILLVDSGANYNAYGNTCNYGSYTISGGAEVNLFGNLTNYYGGTFVADGAGLGADYAIEVTGAIENDGTMQFVDVSVASEQYTTFVNNGTLQVSGGSEFQMDGSTFTNNGSFSIDSTSTMWVDWYSTVTDNSGTYNDGSIYNSGTWYEYASFSGGGTETGSIVY